MSGAFLEIGIILVLLVANGVFAAAEIAIVSSRRHRLTAMASRGDRGAAVAGELARDPGRFLSTVQVGITLVGVLAGAFGGATLAEEIAAYLATFPGIARYAEPIGLVVVVIGITYASLIVGELVPKRVALANPEGIARALARPMNRLSRLAAPLVALLETSTEVLLRLFRVRSTAASPVSDDEVKVLMQEGSRSGVFHRAEPELVERVLRLDRLAAVDVMTPRADVVWADADAPAEAVGRFLARSGHTWFPVYRGDRDDVVGIVSIKAVYAVEAEGGKVDLAALAVPPLYVPETQSAVALLERFKTTGRHVALVVDEFGGVAGLVTMHDILEAIVGELPKSGAAVESGVVRREDGSYLVDASLLVEDLIAAFPDFPFDPPSEREYRTVAGFVAQRLGKVPTEGEAFDAGRYRIEVVDMDRRRIDKVLVGLRP